jgi:predicted ArsR family transcriptional regulator
LAGLAALAEPARRALYQYVVSRPEPLSREEAARGVGVAHHVAKFHLDKLVEEGLLDIEYRRPPGRGGPGAGRPAKLYRRSERELDVTVPERRYELASRLLASAVTEAQRDDVAVGAALEHAATVAGRALGDEVRVRVGKRPRRADIVDGAVEVLSEHGYDPRVERDGVTLTNCPFHRLAQDYTELVCGMNHWLLDAMVTEADPEHRTGLIAELDPAPERCCVRLVKGA